MAYSSLPHALLHLCKPLCLTRQTRASLIPCFFSFPRLCRDRSLVPHLPHHADEPAAVEHAVEYPDAPEAPKKTWRSMFALNLNRSLLPSPQCFSLKAEHKEAPTPVQRCACCLEPQVHDHHLKKCTVSSPLLW